MARNLSATFAILLIAAIAAISLAYPFLFPSPVEPATYEIDPAEEKAALDSKLVLEVRGSLSEEEVVEGLTIEPELRVSPQIEVRHIARLHWHEGFDWAKTRITINPSGSEIFAPDTRYTATFRDHRFLEFETIRLPDVVGARASEIDPEGSGALTTSSSVVLLFNEEIIWSHGLLEVEPPAPVSTRVSQREDGRTEVRVTPETRWENETSYRISIPRGIEDIHGHMGIAKFEYEFATRPAPGLVVNGPSGESNALDSAVGVQFGRDADREAVEGSFAIEPAAEGTFEWTDERTLFWRPERLEYSTQYTVRLAGEDTNGDPFRTAEWSFETHDPPVSVEIEGGTEAPTYLTAKVTGGLDTREIEWSTGEKGETVLALAPAGEAQEISVTVRSGDQTATASAQIRGHPRSACPRGWDMLEIGVCYMRQVLQPGPVQVHIARLDYRDPAIELRSIPANGRPGVGATVAESARAHGSLVAINGDFFARDRSSYYPTGPMVTNGVSLYQPASDMPVFALDGDGNSWVGAGSYFPDRTSLSEIDFAVGGSHILLHNRQGVPVDSHLGGLNPRTAIGIDKQGFVYFVVVDGRSRESVGMSLYTLQRYLQDIGIKDAVNLDGGGSTTMVVRGQVVNVPSDGGERSVASVVDVRRR